jgi:hypothetical protein
MSVDNVYFQVIASKYIVLRTILIGRNCHCEPIYGEAVSTLLT